MSDQTEPTPPQPDGEISEELKVHVDTDQLQEWDKVRDDYAVDRDTETRRPEIAEDAEDAEDPDAGSAGD